MKPFLVEIKAKDKSASWSYTIQSQDETTAEKWAEKCLEAQKRDVTKYRFVATPIVVEKEAAPVQEKPEEKQKKTKPRKT